LGCTIYELITGDYLFKPQKGSNFSTEEDHLALMIETLGPMDIQFSSKGKYSSRYFDEKGKLLRIKPNKPRSIKERLIKKYKFFEKEAGEIEEFLLGMLQYEPNKRKTAKELLNHKWLIISENNEINLNENTLTTQSDSERGINREYSSSYTSDSDENESFLNTEENFYESIQILREGIEKLDNLDEKMKLELKLLSDVINKKLN
jgi:serine/threonine-protein kinase SRPK3